MRTPQIHLKIARQGTNPFVFSKMVKHPYPYPPTGIVAEVIDRDGKFVGRGYYHPSQPISIRLITENPKESVDEKFFHNRIGQAKRLREELLQIPRFGDSYRIAHAEADGLVGMVIDKFGDVIVIEPYCAGLLHVGDWVVSALRAHYPGARVVFRPTPKIEKAEGVSFESLTAKYPCPDFTKIHENGLTLQVNFTTGHKTGFFLDQRDNRALLARLAKGRTVFDLFCYTGGFGLSALKGGATDVTFVDLDEKAIAMARRNSHLNKFPGAGQTAEFLHADVFDYLRECIAAGKQADIVVVDPAKFAGVRDELSVALKKYGDLNKLAVQVVKPGGMLVTCSCSGLVAEDTFVGLISRSAAEAARELQIFQVGGAASDHPFSSRFPQGRYLKAVFARVFDAGRPVVFADDDASASSSERPGWGAPRKAPAQDWDDLDEPTATKQEDAPRPMPARPLPAPRPSPSHDRPRFGDAPQRSHSGASHDRPRFGDAPPRGRPGAIHDRPRFGDAPPRSRPGAGHDRPRFGDAPPSRSHAGSGHDRPRFSDAPPRGRPGAGHDRPRFGDAPPRGRPGAAHDRPRFGDAPSRSRTSASPDRRQFGDAPLRSRPDSAHDRPRSSDAPPRGRPGASHDRPRSSDAPSRGRPGPAQNRPGKRRGEW